MGITLFILADPVYAWGPAMHYYLGRQLFELGLVGGTLGSLIAQNWKGFLFGNVVADVIVGKNMIDVEQHSHHWSVARRLRERADSAPHEAFAVGYWTHLASDTVAHNVFLTEERTPSRITSPKMRHVYLEFQADTWVPPEVPDQLRDLLSHDFGEERQLLEDAVPRTVLPFRMNWFVMDNVLKFAGKGTTRRLANLVDQWHSYDFNRNNMLAYYELSLVRMEESLRGDPNRVTRLSPMSKGARFLEH